MRLGRRGVGTVALEAIVAKRGYSIALRRSARSAEVARLCTPARSDGRHACTMYEVCTKDGAACASEGSRCSRGACRLAARTVTCGDERCRAPKPECCVDLNEGTTRCAAVGDCSSEPLAKGSLECASPKDCPPGMRCLLYMGSSACEGEGLWAHGSLLCQTAADCPTDPDMLRVLGISGFKCLPHPQARWLSTCER